MASFFDSYFSTEQRVPKLVEPKLDFSLDSKDFVEWLKTTGEDSSGETYSEKVSSMCEYSCLYIAKILENKKLKGELKFCLGDYGCWQHYWASYTIDNLEYFVDLTLAQFIRNSPELSISLASDSVHETTYNNIRYISFDSFLNERRRDLNIIEEGKAIALKDWYSGNFGLRPFDESVLDGISF